MASKVKMRTEHKKEVECFIISIDGITPATKGSYNAVSGVSKRTGAKVTRLIPSDKRERAWRDTIVLAVKSAKDRPEIHRDDVLDIGVRFYLPRPKSVLAEQRPEPTVKPDLDKLLRALFDGLTDSGLIVDDSQICSVIASKRYVVSQEKAGMYLDLYYHHDSPPF